MTSQTDVRLTPGQRLGRGLKYTAVGPVDITRGTVGLGLLSARSSASWAGHRYQRGKSARQLRRSLVAAQNGLGDEFGTAEVVANLPAVGRGCAKRRRIFLFAGIATVVLAGGAVAFSKVRRSVRSQPEPSPRPPSVEVDPKP
jgi:hypothetical protein